MTTKLKAPLPAAALSVVEICARTGMAGRRNQGRQKIGRLCR
jgi:hypothetical protein